MRLHLPTPQAKTHLIPAGALNRSINLGIAFCSDGHRIH